MKLYSRFIGISIFVLSAHVLLAQENDIILKAMQDELQKNMSELLLPNFDKPFYIMYGVQDQKTYVVIASQGSLRQSSEVHQRFKNNTRVLVGDYSFNDESLEDDLFSPPNATEISLPLEDDYFGIRRSFWSSTDKVYRDAARHFDKHKVTLKESGKTLAELPHRSFAKSDPVKVISSLTPQTFDRKAWEEKARTLSRLFLKDTSIMNSAVVIQYVEGHSYIVTSEGTIAKVPFSHATVMAMGQSKNAAGELSFDQISHSARTSDQLPTEQQLTNEINELLSGLVKQSLPELEEEYSGPVLISGQAVAELFSNALFRGRENLVANHAIPALTGIQFNREMNSMDSKIGKPVLHESVSVKAKPKLKSFNGVELLGNFEIDDEGIVPVDELVLVDKGVLKNLLNDRTITQPTQTANGFSAGPGVVEISIAQKNSDKVLKDKLIDRAKKEGLDYAIIVREAPAMGFGMVNVIRVSVADGKEELIQNAVMNPGNLKTLKRILGASEKYSAYNLSPPNRNGGFGINSIFTSYIVPESILVEELLIQPFKMPSIKEEQYVSSPLK